MYRYMHAVSLGRLAGVQLVSRASLSLYTRSLHVPTTCYEERGWLAFERDWLIISVILSNTQAKTSMYCVYILAREN